MIAEIGFGSLFISLIISVYGVIAAIYGERNHQRKWVFSAKQAMRLVFPLLTLSIGSLIFLILNNNFEVVYVASVSSINMPVYLKITAIWGGQAGSMLFWSWLLAGFGFIVTFRKWDRDQDFLPWVIAICLGTIAFFVVLNTFFENPFVRYWQVNQEIVQSFVHPPGGIQVAPRNGGGLNPLLRHPGMIIHPPMQYLGFVAFIVPYAFAMASLITGRSDDRWIQLSRPWAIWAWLFLSLGLILGARWAYDVLGWGGYWGWDPVENSALMPWLSGTAFLHAVLIQEKRNMFKQWPIVLIIVTYNLVIFGTFLTRSGLLSSVHSFARSSIGPIFLAFIALTFIASFWLLSSRWEKFKSRQVLTSFFSKEALILITIILFLGMLVTTFWGVIFPNISELVTGQKVTVGPPFYERVAGPILGGVLVIMVICPLAVWSFVSFKHLGKLLWKPFIVSLLGVLLPIYGGLTKVPAVIAFWLVAFVLAVNGFEFIRRTRLRRRSQSESLFQTISGVFQRNKRSYSAMIIHVGMVFMALGIIGIEFFQTETQGTIAEGQELQLASYTMEYEQLDIFNTSDDRNVARAVILVKKDGQVIDEIYPRRDFYYDSNQQVTIPGVRSTLVDDFYTILVDWKAVTSEGATFKVYHNPLVKWLWIGAWTIILGVVVTSLPDNRSTRAGSRTRGRDGHRN
ncbi:MAG TPA: heme lyase CcmF/NrfE family subunit [Chloroflexi bacterium]|nr:heme lyase CcmF/NrfE family subunit [Chloroflexota bacterium]